MNFTFSLPQEKPEEYSVVVSDRDSVIAGILACRKKHALLEVGEVGISESQIGK